MADESSKEERPKDPLQKTLDPNKPSDSETSQFQDFTLENTEQQNVNLKLPYDFTIDIIDKQYRSYVWNDGKVQALITVDTALIAGLFIVLQIYHNVELTSFYFLACSFVYLLISFLVCLMHAIPRIHSGVGNQQNLRTLIGINNNSKEGYYQKILRLNFKEMLQMNCWQISGMCKNNLRSHKLIRVGVIFTISGVITFATALTFISLYDWHPYYKASKTKAVSSIIAKPIVQDTLFNNIEGK